MVDEDDIDLFDDVGRSEVVFVLTVPARVPGTGHDHRSEIRLKPLL